MPARFLNENVPLYDGIRDDEQKTRKTLAHVPRIAGITRGESGNGS